MLFIIMQNLPCCFYYIVDVLIRKVIERCPVLSVNLNCRDRCSKGVFFS